MAKLVESSLMEKYRETNQKTYSELDMPNWKRLKLDGIVIPEFKNYDKMEIESRDVSVRNIMDVSDDEIGELVQDRAFGVDPKFTAMAGAYFNTGAFIKVPQGFNSKKPVMVNYMSSGDVIIDHNVIIAEPFSSVDIIIGYNGVTEDYSFHNGITMVVAKEGAKINLIKLQRLSDASFNFDSIIGIAGRDSSINWTVIEMGSYKSAVNYTSYMENPGSENMAKGIFFLDGKRGLDMSFKVYHIAPNTVSDIDIRGALKDEAYSVFRGDLDIRRGAKKSKGNEKESVLLLDRSVRSDAIPALKCAEEDVEAGHAASCGELNENTLYYMMSRGLSLDEARMLLVEASFNPVIDVIPDDEIRESVKEAIKRRLIR